MKNGVPIVLSATSAYERPVDKTTGARLWSQFLQHGTTHSSRAETLPYIIRRCESEGIGYVLEAMPGLGYHIKQRKA